MAAAAGARPGASPRSAAALARLSPARLGFVRPGWARLRSRAHSLCSAGLGRPRWFPPFGSAPLRALGRGEAERGAGRPDGRASSGARRGPRLACHSLRGGRGLWHLHTRGCVRTLLGRAATLRPRAPSPGAARAELPEGLPPLPRPFRRSAARVAPLPQRLRSGLRAPGARPAPRRPPPPPQPGAMATAAEDGAVKPLQCAMKLANGAIELDTGNQPREAYTEYLRSIHYISQVLLEEVEAAKEAGETVPPDTSKMLKLAEQCLERAQSTAAKLGRTRLKPAMPLAAPVPSPTSRHRRVYSDEGGKLSPFLPPEIFQKLQVAESQSSKKELTPLEEASLQNQKLKAAYEARMARLDPSQATQKTSLSLSLQRQMMENLVIAKAREQTLQRKMGERRLRLQEAANRRFCSQVALTPEEQEQRALYAAILEYEQDHDWPKHWKAKLKKSPGDLSLVTSLVSHLLSVPDHPISQLLKKLQCAVYRALYPIVSRGANELLGPGSRRLRPSQSLYCVLSTPEPSLAPQPLDGLAAGVPPSQPRPPDGGVDSSPLGPPSPLAHTTSHSLGKDSSFEDLEQFLATSERSGRNLGGRPEPQFPEVKEQSLDQLTSTVKDIHNAVGWGPWQQMASSPFQGGELSGLSRSRDTDSLWSPCSPTDPLSYPFACSGRLLSLTLLAFEGLNTASSKDRCLACIEEPFFSPLWPLLLALYRSVHRLREAALSRSMELYRNAPPAAIGIPTKLLPQDGPEARGVGSFPYCAAAQELGLLVLETCPQKKLECIVRALRVTCACAEDYCRAREPTSEAGPQPGVTAIGADDLLPILSFVVLRSGLPQLVSECAALEEFIHDGYLMGEEGYCLTSLQSALRYVELLPPGALGR
ncbi:VPS9 domain-containing protein 1 isoform X2 [Manis pentadactyla]|uniref:VPS9 domain-containing protein 1 isoform X2 n=2 Tax=Manis pentadactyla TaxID=143292 RepID=UPI00255D0F03|nr:VPS9 domain-containing protein 1 isoform X2 [Manis pentadactyla]